MHEVADALAVLYFSAGHKYICECPLRLVAYRENNPVWRFIKRDDELVSYEYFGAAKAAKAGA